MDRLHAMQVFAAVARSGGFAAAARQLGMSPPAVTRTIAALEDRIGTRLFSRTTRSVSLTEAGHRYLVDVERLLQELDDAEAAAQGLHASPRGLLTVTAPVMFGRLYIAPILLDFLDQHPDVTGRLLLLDRVTNLLEEGMDVALRISHLGDSSMAAIRVGSVRSVICASPDYLKRHAVPQHPGDLAAHRLIVATSSLGIQEWRFGKDDSLAVRINPALVCNSNAAVVQAVESGWGISRLLSYQVGPSIAAGRIRLVLESFERAPLPVHLVHLEGRRASAKVRAFIDFAASRLRSDPVINPR
ncbi:LysR family transcriptional regulator [Blastomonas fulva]|uniref:LysR family transcriptional regulator n=1 Tax=Blastomonas fulva TaxID=1550728 RepID=UPI003F6ED9A1